MSTLAVVEEILRETKVPMSVREIVRYAGVVRMGGRLPTRSKTPDTVVARDLSVDIKKKGEASLFVRTEPGRYTLRELMQRIDSSGRESAPGTSIAPADSPVDAAHRIDAARSEDQPAMTAPLPAQPVGNAVDTGGATIGVSAIMQKERSAPLPARTVKLVDSQADRGR